MFQEINLCCVRLGEQSLFGIKDTGTLRMQKRLTDYNVSTSVRMYENHITYFIVVLEVKLLMSTNVHVYFFRIVNN